MFCFAQSQLTKVSESVTDISKDDEDDNDDDDDEQMSTTSQDSDPDRLKAFNVRSLKDFTQ